MRLVGLVIGVLALLISIIWTLQGLNVLSGSAMSGHPIFTVIGVIVGIIGLILVAIGLQHRRIVE